MVSDCKASQDGGEARKLKGGASKKKSRRMPCVTLNPLARLKLAIRPGGKNNTTLQIFSTITMPTQFSPDQEHQGLSNQQAEALLEKNGLNALPEPKPLTLPMIFLRQFLSPFIYILMTAAVIAFALDQLPSAIFIVLVLNVNAIIGTIQEFSAQKSAVALRNIVRGSCEVIREGKVMEIDIRHVVDGDLVLLSSGNKVPADGVLLESQRLAVDESMLTGESDAVNKNANATVADDAPLAERFNQVFAGCLVTQGRGMARITATGQHTQLGSIADKVAKTHSADPPLVQRIRRFTYHFAMAIAVAIVLLMAVMWFNGGFSPEEMMLMAIGLAVSAIPEGLPAAITITLAIGMQRMARRNVVIRKLIAVEALGSCTFICSDKTGTLTVNELTIRELMLPDGSSFRVTGEGIASGGEIINNSDTAISSTDHLRDLCTCGVLANESHLDYAGEEWQGNGDKVDLAFLVLAKKLGISLTRLKEQQPQCQIIPYESEQAFACSLNHCESTARVYVKGSPERILGMCDKMWLPEGNAPIDKDRIEQQFVALASEGYRVIALAHAPADANEEVECQLIELTFLGLVAMIDPVRHEAFDAVETCRSGGIEVAMITGDHPATAKAIAAQLGLCDKNAEVVSGQKMREAEEKNRLDEMIRPARVFARIEPHQKQQIVQSLSKAGEFVAVTGDGVNDAPAMRAAHVGVAMSKRGTDVARETADLNVTDDNFASLVAGVEEGRIVYNNIRKVIGMLVAGGFAALLLFFLTAFFGLPMPLLAVQLLWLNLIANGLQDVALACESKEGGELDQPPRKPDEPIIDKHVIEHALLIGGSMGIMTFGVFWTLVEMGQPIEVARNLTLMQMILFRNIHALSRRSETKSIFRMPLSGNVFLLCAVPTAQLIHIGGAYTPWLSDVLALTPIAFDDWLTLLGLAMVLLVIEELHKLWLRHRHRKATAKSENREEFGASVATPD